MLKRATKSIYVILFIKYKLYIVYTNCFVFLIAFYQWKSGWVFCPRHLNFRYFILVWNNEKVKSMKNNKYNMVFCCTFCYFIIYSIVRDLRMFEDSEAQHKNNVLKGHRWNLRLDFSLFCLLFNIPYKCICIIIFFETHLYRFLPTLQSVRMNEIWSINSELIKSIC